MIKMIWCEDINHGIAKNNQLPWHMKEEMLFFKNTTLNNIVVMGKNTWLSLNKKPLVNRSNIIISNAQRLIMCQNTLRLHMEDIIEYFKYTKDEVFIIGGGSIYKQLLPYCEKVYVTKINKSHENIDTYFPNLDELDEWTLGESSEVYEYNDFTYQFCQYDRL